jgi:ribosomal protein L29
MTTLKFKEIVKMSKSEREKKLKELKLELIKSLGKAGGKAKEIKKIIARINTIKQ